MKIELREDVSGPSSTSDESDSDSPTEVSVQVKGILGNTAVFYTAVTDEKRFTSVA